MLKKFAVEANVPGSAFLTTRILFIVNTIDASDDEVRYSMRIEDVTPEQMRRMEDLLFGRHEDPEALESLTEGIRHLYRKARYPSKAVNILGIFEEQSMDELMAILGTLDASVRYRDTLSVETVEIVVAGSMHTVSAVAYRHLDGPTVTRRRVRDILTEFMLRACYDHVARTHSGSDHGSARLPFIINRLGGSPLIEKMESRMSARDDRDIEEIGIMLRAMDVIDRRIDDDRIRKTYLELKNKPFRTLELERRTRFRSVFGYIEFDPVVTDDDERGMWLCFEELRNGGLLPEIPSSKDLCFKVRRMSDWGGLYVQSPKLIIVGANDYGSFVHEYGHAFDYAMGGLSRSRGFAHVLKRYRQAFDAECAEAGDSSMSEYFRSPAECFARCFEMYVMMRHGPCILLRDYSPKRAYPKDSALRRDICAYFDGLYGSGRP